jgi:hypothetical protein
VERAVTRVGAVVRRVVRRRVRGVVARCMIARCFAG